MVLYEKERLGEMIMSKVQIEMSKRMMMCDSSILAQVTTYMTKNRIKVALEAKSLQNMVV